MPPQIRVLAFVGILIGSTSALFAASVAQHFLVDKEEFVNLVRTQLAAMPSPSPSPSPSPAPEVGETPEHLAEALYDRRGVVLPLAGISLILSTLLLAGCFRALRGSAWGASAWKIACAVWLPYQLIGAIFVVVGTGQPGLAIASILSCIYCVVCLLYLRRPQIAALFK